MSFIPPAISLPPVHPSNSAAVPAARGAKIPAETTIRSGSPALTSAMHGEVQLTSGSAALAAECDTFMALFVRDE